jgi:DNA-binding Xre family transcriptional regulator
VPWGWSDPPDQLREIMASRGVFTTHLAPLLAERAITLSASQIHRLVTGTPERLSLPVLAALCDLLEVTPAELIVTSAENATTRKTAAATGPAPVAGPTRARVSQRCGLPVRRSPVVSFHSRAAGRARGGAGNGVVAVIPAALRDGAGQSGAAAGRPSFSLTTRSTHPGSLRAGERSSPDPVIRRTGTAPDGMG